MYGYNLLVFKVDRRCKNGERLLGVYPYSNYSGNAMMDEIFSLRQSLYKREDGYRLDFEPMTENTLSK